MKIIVPAESMKKVISYLILLSYCPANSVDEFKRNTAPMLKQMAWNSCVEEKTFLAHALPEACCRIVTYHQAARQPDPLLVKSLLDAALSATDDAGSLAGFKKQVSLISALPGRARPENRLHRNKGCRLCADPCRHGYFTLVSDPDFSKLQALYAAEVNKPAASQNPLIPAYLFTQGHLQATTGAREIFCERVHQANLAFCLLMLGIAKSRLPFPDRQLRIFQSANQDYIRQQGAVTSG